MNCPGVCQPRCNLHAECPYVLGRVRARFRKELHAKRVVGPVDFLTGRWMETVEGWNPWRETNEPD